LHLSRFSREKWLAVEFFDTWTRPSDKYSSEVAGTSEAAPLLDPDDSSAVISGLRHGDRDAWTALYDRYSVAVWRYVARLVGSPNSVADVVQETFLAAARSARNFDPQRGSLASWLNGIAHHQAALYWRQHSRSERLRKLAEAGAAELRHWLDGTEPIEDEWNRRELADLVRGVLAEVSADYAALLSAKYFEGQSLETIAQATGGSIDAVKSKLARARREFRAKFEHLTREPLEQEM
jgi:RNA polymerase sigma-70 factor (ECF subfamily)